jgi:subtilisin-like proprotein convertase family protein
VTASKLRFGLLVAILAALVLPGTASAAPVLVHESTTVTESAPRDGVIAGGDTITIVERIRNVGSASLTNVAGTLTSSTAGVTIDTAASSYPDLGVYATADNAIAFQVELPSTLPCGAIVHFSLAATANASGSGDPVADDIAFTVRAGFVSSTTTGYDRGRATDIPNGTASLTPFGGLAGLGGPGTGTSTITVPSTDTGTVAAISVGLGHLHYPLGHLQISLRAPNGRQIVLLDHRGGAAQDLDNTVFTAGGADPASVSDFTGATVRPEESFDALLGSTRNGSWKLIFNVDDSSELGLLDDWHIDLTLADCAPRAFASLAASPRQAPPGTDVTLDASGTVVDGPATYSYSGDYTSITGGSTAQAHVSFSQRGTHTVSVTVTDVHGAIFSADADVIVSTPPTADLQPQTTTVLTGDPLQFDASGSSDPDVPGGIVKYEWSIDGGAFQTATSTETFSFAKPGTHGVAVRVTDTDGATDEATAVVTASNRPPVAALALGSSPAVTGRTTVLDASGSTDDGTIVKYLWDLDGDGTFEVDGGAAKTRSVVFSTNGPHVVNVRTVDDYGDTGDKQLTVDVTDPPVAGTIDATPAQPRPGATVTLTVNGAADDDGTIDHYEWNFGDGTTDVTDGAHPSTTHAFAVAAMRTITVRVFDNDLASTTTTRQLAIGGVPPVAVLTVNPNPVTQGAVVHLDASGSHDSDSPISGYRWDLDDDGIFERDTGATPSVDTTYPNAGALTVRVRVTDVDGNSGVASVALAIAEPVGSVGAGTGGSSPGGQEAGGGSGGGAAGGGSAGGGAATVSGHSFAATLVADAIQRQDKVLKSGLVVSCRTNRAATCTLRIEIAGRDARRLGLSRSARKPVVVARGTARSDGSKPGNVKLRMSRSVAAKLRRVARVTVTVAGEATAADGDKAKLARSVLVRRR